MLLYVMYFLVDDELLGCEQKPCQKGEVCIETPFILPGYRCIGREP